MEKELLAIVMCLKEYRSMLFGGRLTIYTDHKNLTFKTLSAQRVLRWRLYLEDFDVTFKYIEGKKNVLADCFSWLPIMAKPTVGKKEQQGLGKLIDFVNIKIPKDEDDVFFNELPVLLPSICGNDDTDIIECFLNLPALQEMQCPITTTMIRNHQLNDPTLQLVRLEQPLLYPIKSISGQELVCRNENPMNGVEDAAN